MSHSSTRPRPSSPRDLLLAVAAIVAACTPRSRPAEEATPTPAAPPPAAEAAADTGGEARPAALPAPEPPPSITRHEPRPRTIAATSSHACALAGAGKVACWGAGREGQLGPGIAEHRASPTLVAGIDDAVAVLAATRASCALRADGQLTCWGKIDAASPGLRTTRALGEIVELAMSDYSDRVCARRGDGSVACVILGKLSQEAAMVVPGIADAVGIELDSRDLFVLRAGGEVVSITIQERELAAPVAVEGGPFVDLARVGGRLCLLHQSGEMRCRGYPGTWRPEVPVAGPMWKGKVPGELWARAVDYDGAGGFHCVRDGEGEVLCWGDNAYGQLGSGTPAYSVAPRRIFARAAEAVSAGADQSCGVFAGGELACYQQAFDEEIEVEGVRAVALSTGHNCAIVGGGEARCWGYSDVGALGSPGETDSLVKVPGLSDLVRIGVGDDHSCAVRRDHTVRCWGSGAAGQLADVRYLSPRDEGEGETDEETERTYAATPLTIKGLAGDVTHLAVAGDYACAATTVGLHCWGTIPEPADLEDAVVSQPMLVHEGAITAIDAEDSSLCLVDGAGALHCWGPVAASYQDGDFIKLDHDDHDDHDDEDDDGPEALPEPDEGPREPFRRGGPLFRLGGLAITPIDLAVGSDHACLLTAAGEVHCWGENAHGQLGDGTTVDRAAPVKVKGLPGPAKQIAAGSQHTCARTEDGGVYCWGSKTAPREHGRRAAPGVVPGLEPYTRAAGASGATAASGAAAAATKP